MVSQKLKINTDPRVDVKFNAYPSKVRKKLANLRRLIMEAAAENDLSMEVEETLKWGEPSYLVKKGSTIRMDWKAKAPDQYAIYFKCTSKLVPTFKKLYGDLFSYEKTRAILFKLNEAVPEKELKVCIALALNYHRIKHLPNLGAMV